MQYYISVDLGLPPPSQYAQQSRDLAFPQIIAFATACAGLAISLMILRAFSGKL